MPDTLAVLAGAVAAAAALVLPFVLRSTGDRATVGAVVCAAVLGGTGYAPLGLLVATALVLMSWRAPILVRVGSVLLAAVLFGAALPKAADAWLGLLVAAAVLAAMRVVHKARVPFGSAATLAMLAWVPIAAYGAVPDTEHVTVVGVAVAVVALAELVAGGRPSAAGTAAFVGLIVWSIGAGAAGREAAAIGALGCFALLLLGPVARLTGRSVRWLSVSGVSLAALHAVTAVVAARFAGLEQGAATAAWKLLVVLVPALALGLVLVMLAPRLQQSGGTST
ncbi:MAG: hypothetical protein ACR2OH_05495 [Microthrixaceae bacterium]